MYRTLLRIWMKNLWYFTRGCNEARNSVPLPPYVCVAFTNPEMPRRVREERDLAVRAIGHCVEALVVNRLAADINLRNALVSSDELACLSAILGTKSNDVTLLLRRTDAIQFTNMVFFALGDFYTSSSARVSLDVSDVIQRTFDILSCALPAPFNARIQLDPANTLMNISDGECELVLRTRFYRLKIHVSDLTSWDCFICVDEEPVAFHERVQ